MSTLTLHKAQQYLRTFRLWTEQEREASLQKTLNELTEQKDIWIFGYGSLVWRPEFTFEDSHLARLDGYRRALCLWSGVNRGTPEMPGLVFGLQKGGACEGRVYRLPNDNLLTQLRQLWKREMPSEAYLPMWLPCETDSGIVKALVFVMDENSDAYISDLSEEETIDIVLNASGSYGPCHEYVTQTADALLRSGIQDEKLLHLSNLIKSRLTLGSHA